MLGHGGGIAVIADEDRHAGNGAEARGEFHVVPAQDRDMHEHALIVDQPRQGHAHAQDARRGAGALDDGIEALPDRDAEPFGRAVEGLVEDGEGRSVHCAGDEFDPVGLDQRPDQQPGIGRDDQPFGRPPPAIAGLLDAALDQAELGEAVDDRGHRGFVDPGPGDDLGLRDIGLHPYAVEDRIGVETADGEPVETRGELREVQIEFPPLAIADTRASPRSFPWPVVLS